MPRIGIILKSALGAFALFAVAECLLTASSEARQAGPGAVKQGRSVWDGVYTAEQAAKGKETYDLYCSNCHGNDLGGIDGPTLVGKDFLRNWMEDNLNALVQKIQKRMPADAPGSLSMESNTEITAFLLQANEFPAGKEPMPTDESLLTQIMIQGKDGPAPVPNFSMVLVVGCLSQRADGVWMVGSGTEPVRTREAAPDPSKPSPSASTALGTQTFNLMDVTSAKPENFKGQKVEVRGLLMRQPNETRLNVTSLSGLGGGCGA